MKLIVAREKSGGIGIDNSLPWDFIREDMKWFQQCTKGKCVVMGRKTYESIGKPLPSRHNIVVTSNPDKYVAEDNLQFMSLEEFIKSSYVKYSWLIGGESLYKELLPLVLEAYITEINQDYECDSYFDTDLSVEGFDKVMSTELKEGVRVETYWRN